MKYEWANNTHLLIPMAIFVVSLVLSFAVTFFAFSSIILRQDFFGSIDEQALSWSERLGKRETRLRANFWSPRFLLARRLIAYGAIVFFCSLGAVILIAAVYGDPS